MSSLSWYANPPPIVQDQELTDAEVIQYIQDWHNAGERSREVVLTIVKDVGNLHMRAGFEVITLLSPYSDHKHQISLDLTHGISAEFGDTKLKSGSLLAGLTRQGHAHEMSRFLTHTIETVRKFGDVDARFTQIPTVCMQRSQWVKVQEHPYIKFTMDDQRRDRICIRDGLKHTSASTHRGQPTAAASTGTSWQQTSSTETDMGNSIIQTQTHGDASYTVPQPWGTALVPQVSAPQVQNRQHRLYDPSGCYQQGAHYSDIQGMNTPYSSWQGQQADPNQAHTADSTNYPPIAMSHGLHGVSNYWEPEPSYGAFNPPTTTPPPEAPHTQATHYGHTKASYAPLSEGGDLSRTVEGSMTSPYVVSPLDSD